MPEPKLDESTEPKVAQKPEPTLPVTEKPKKLQLSPEELDDIKAKAVAEAREKDEESRRLAEAEEQGNYKQLLEDKDAELRKTNLALWRTKALNKFGLNEKLFDALTGDTEKAIMDSAKMLKAHIDSEVEAQLVLKRDGITSPKTEGRNIPPREQKVNGMAKSRSQLKQVLGLGNTKAVGIH
jgi:hypothetical protein